MRRASSSGTWGTSTAANLMIVRFWVSRARRKFAYAPPLIATKTCSRRGQGLTAGPRRAFPLALRTEGQAVGRADKRALLPTVASDESSEVRLPPSAFWRDRSVYTNPGRGSAGGRGSARSADTASEVGVDCGQLRTSQRAAP